MAVIVILENMRSNGFKEGLARMKEVYQYCSGGGVSELRGQRISDYIMQTKSDFGAPVTHHHTSTQEA